MSDLANAEVQPGADTSSTDVATLSDDDALGAVWDKMERDNGAERGSDGRFQRTGGAEEGQGAEPGTDAEGGDAEGSEEPQAAPAEGQEGGDEKPAAAVALPPNWNGMDEDWKKIPADVQAKIAARDTELHARMSDMGRQIGASKPFMDIVAKNNDLFEGKIMADGTVVTPTFAVNFLMDVQRQMEADPIRTLAQLAQNFGVHEHLGAVLTGQKQLPAVAAKASAGLQPADVQAMIRQAITETTSQNAEIEELSRWSKDKPLYAEIAEDDLVHAIHRARARLGGTASREAVLDAAYDMCVHADPALRAKVAAAAQKPAAAPTSNRAAEARRAASVNVTSRQTGKTREPTEDELLGAVFDAAQSKD